MAWSDTDGIGFESRRLYEVTCAIIRNGITCRVSPSHTYALHQAIILDEQCGLMLMIHGLSSTFSESKLDWRIEADVYSSE